MTPTLHRSGDAVYLEVDGERWRVHDCDYVRHRLLRLPLPSARAKYRVFVNENDTRRAYKFSRGDIRELTATRLEAQLKAAGYIFPRHHQSDPWVPPVQR